MDRHQKPNGVKTSAIKYRIFCNLLEELKSGSIESFEDPDYPLVSGNYNLI